MVEDSKFSDRLPLSISISLSRMRLLSSMGSSDVSIEVLLENDIFWEHMNYEL